MSLELTSNSGTPSADNDLAIRFKYHQVNDHIIMHMDWASD